MVTLLKEGDRFAFEEIYERYWFKLYLTAVKRVKSDENAKDLVQDLFISLWLRKETLTINTSLSSYLFAAIKYKIINYVEANIVKNNYLSSLEKEAIDYDNSTNESIIYNDLEQFIESGISHLSPRVKVIFELSRKEKLSVNEIAQKLDISEQTVKNQISKAIRTLRLYLSNTSAIYLLFILQVIY